MQLEDAPVPTCGPDDLLARVVAAGVNPIDWKMRRELAEGPAPGIDRLLADLVLLGRFGH